MVRFPDLANRGWIRLKNGKLSVCERTWVFEVKPITNPAGFIDEICSQALIAPPGDVR
jgi:hypothetical protein